MPRNHISGASTLRNRNRITNKTRLKIIRGNVEGDDLLIPDEDEEKHRLTNLVAGVDAEDANEHHLQEVLSAAHRVQLTKKTEEKPTVYIPTPEAGGHAENWEQLYPAGVWKDPATFVCTSTSVEESVRDGLANGFSYFMDERDKEWLDKNNEEARGEGTSAQGAISTSTTRTSARSAKAKGKEPDVSQPVVISEDEFELVMGLFEKVTHEKTEFLHHSLETGMPFPAFTEYQDVFSNPLTPAMFANHTVPTWIPQSQQLLRIARTVYSYWKERRIERAGHRIIPTLNFDESDTLNESYICFRRREIKAVRKTRQAQVTSSDKLVRLQQEFAYPLELARHVLQRETTKREQAVQAQQVWERRMALADLKRKFPSLSDKTDEDLLVDKERPAKRPEPSRLGVKIPANNANLQPLRPEPVIKPRERIAQVREKTEAYLARRKDEDKIWDDVIDNPQQTPYTPYASRLFKFIPPPSTPSYPGETSSDKTSSESDEDRNRPSRAIRMRRGRNGRLLLDRREFGTQPTIVNKPRSALLAKLAGDRQDDEDQEEVDRRKRLEERWRFDADDAPPPPTAEEDNRVLVDEYDPKYLRHSMTLLQDQDHYNLSVDPALILPTQDGRQQTVIPYRLGMPPMVRQPPQMRPPPPHILAAQAAAAASAPPTGVPVSVSVQMKKMPPPTAIPQQMRISSNGGMRLTPGLQSNGSQQSPPQPVALPPAQHAPINGVNGGGRAAIAMPHVDMVKPAEPTVQTNGTPTPAATPDVATPTSQDAPTPNPAPARPKSSNQILMNGLNGYQVNPATSTALATQAAFLNYQQQLQQNGQLTMQKMQDLKTAVFNSLPPSAQAQQIAAMQAAAQSNRTFAQAYLHPGGGATGMQIPAGANMKIPAGAVRQLQWSMGAAMGRPASAMNGVDGAGAIGNPNVNGNGTGGGGLAPPSGQHLNLMQPVRSPSANGIRPGMRVPGSAGGHQIMSPHLGGLATPMPNISQGASPPRHPMTPTMGMASPPIQHQQPVGSTQNGY
ncbi:hypothetical protein D9611_010314 [Ephemerocybe angulata]|uniref:Enhancer of polycomb-like protein n=1 Tax=Ephemerocybe angulata TaxID=980116 RepID=A0A8H5BBN0_9AGAR|nr:hypothetical protein D9611_010314 [Tulosesus angulatus]